MELKDMSSKDLLDELNERGYIFLAMISPADIQRTVEEVAEEMDTDIYAIGVEKTAEVIKNVVCELKGNEAFVENFQEPMSYNWDTVEQTVRNELSKEL